MIARLLASIGVVSFVLTACGSGAGEELRLVVGGLDKTEQRSRTYTYLDESIDGSQTIEVSGRFEDDFRYAGTVRVNGKDWYEMVVSDDAVALRVIDREALAPITAMALSRDAPTGRALLEQRWVVDHTAAPELRRGAEASDELEDSAGQEPAGALAESSPIGDDPFFDAVNATRYAEDSFRVAPSVDRFNPEDVEYNPADDPWSSDDEERLEQQGIRRLDISQPPLPRRAARGEAQRTPSVVHFRKMAVYLKGQDAVELREQISISDRKEFRRAEQGRTAEYYLELRNAARRGAITEPLRERRMTFRVTSFEDADVVLPADAESGLLDDVIGPSGLKTLFGFKSLGGRGGVAPASPSAAPSPSS